MRITRGGQISIPARVRKRWATSTVVLEDEGDRVVLTPAADDPIAAAEGALARYAPGFEQARLRRAAREAEQAAEQRRKR